MTEPARIRLLVPNAVSFAGLLAGFVSMLAAADERYGVAVYLLLLAILFDVLDGRLARMLKATSKFGQEMDSFSDAVSFGIAPAFLAQRSVLAPLGLGGAAAAMLYVLAAIYRLVRFNLTADVHSKGRRTVGVPTPIAAGYVIALVLMRERVPAPAAALVVAALAALMVSRLPLPEMTGSRALTVAMLVGIGNFLAVVIWPNWYSVAWWNLWNVVILLVARAPSHRSPAAEASR